MVTIDQLSFSYKEGEPLLEDISLTIERGAFIALGGHNGSGKTTLTRLLMGLERAKRGTITFEGEDITHLSVAKRGHFMGYVFQQPERQMFKNTVFEEIAFGPTQKGLSGEAVRTITEEVMAKTGLTDYANVYPLQLRRGIKQRIAIASALVMESKLLILDEPTSGQDCKEKRELIELLCKLNREGLTILLVTHDMDIVSAHCDRALILKRGQLVFDGTPRDLYGKEKELLKTWGLMKPTCVALSESIEGCPYCATMEELEAYLLEGTLAG